MEELYSGVLLEFLVAAVKCMTASCIGTLSIGISVTCMTASCIVILSIRIISTASCVISIQSLLVILGLLQVVLLLSISV